jgi:hypothetical protein
MNELKKKLPSLLGEREAPAQQKGRKSAEGRGEVVNTHLTSSPCPLLYNDLLTMFSPSPIGEGGVRSEKGESNLNFIFN